MALKPFNSIGGFSVGEAFSNVILANGDITTTNITTTGVSNLNSVANVRISGGTSGQAIVTDGSGNLSFATIDFDTLANGNSNIFVYANGNIALSMVGNSNVVVFTGTGANINGYANITGNANVGNIETAQLLATANVTAPQLISNIATGTAPLIVSSNTVVANLNADLLDGFNSASGNTANTIALRDANGNLSANYFVGNGAFLTGIDTSLIANGNSNVSVAANGNVTISVSGNAGVATFTGTGANINGYANVTGNANVANLGTGGLITATGNVTGGNLITGGAVVATGNVSGGNLSTGGTLGVTGNANVGNLGTGGFITATGNVTGGNLITGGAVVATGNVSGGNLSTGGTLGVTGNANVGNLGTATAIITTGNITTVNTGLVQNGNSNIAIAANANLTFTAKSNATMVLTDTGANITGTLGVSANLSALGVLTDNLYYANGTPWDFQLPAGSNTQIQYNDGAGGFGASANFAFDYTNNELELNGNILLGAIGVNQIVNNSNTSLEVRGGYGNATNSNLKLIAGDGANTLNWSAVRLQGNLSGNSAIINETVHAYWRQPTIASNIVVIDTETDNSTNTSTGALQVSGGVGVTGNINIGGALSVTGNIANANNISATNTVFANAANITANLTAGNANLGNLAIASFVQTGELLNGNSNIRIAANGNVTVSSTGNANVVVVSGAGANVVGYVQANGAGTFGSLVSPSLTSNSGALTLTAAAGNENIVLVPTGTGNVDVSARHIVQLADPTNAQDAATKSYVDSVATGLQIHPAVRVTSYTNLTATYANGGTSLTTIAITGGKTIQFSGNHGLSVDDEIYWTNSFNGITAQNAYFVETTPGSDTITVRATYTGAEVTTLTNGTGLTQAALANPGVGATLTNAGANAALTIDSVALSTTNRVLVQGQTNGFENGVYTVTTVGNGSTAWVMTRATDGDQYAPSEVTKLGYGDYFFITSGSGFAGSSYVLTTPTGEITFGITNIAFSQFAAAGSYTAGNGIAINGTVISANVDGITTDIVAGNIVVKTSAVLTTPNIGAATGTSLSVSGNILAGNITSNALVSAADFSASANILANNITANSNITANNATINLALAGNTANFSGNVILPNLTVNLQLAGNTANFSGNVYAAFVQAGSGTPISGLTNPLFAGIANANNFVQAYVHNMSNGPAASADFIAYPNNGDDETGFIDLGITSSTFNAAAFSVTNQNEGYIFMSAPDSSNTSGNLVFATDSTGTFNSIEFFVDGFNQVKSARSMLISTTGVTVTSNANVGGTLGVTGNANVGNLGTATAIITTGNITTINSGLLQNGNSNVTITANGNVTLNAVGGTRITATSVGANVTGTLGVSANLSALGVLTDNLYYANGTPWDLQEAAGANTQIQYNNGTNNNFGASANFTFNDATNVLTVTGNANVTNRLNLGNVSVNTGISWGSLTTTAVTANQTVAQFSVTGVTGVEFLVKGIDSTGTKYSVATLTAVTDGTNVDYSTFGTVNLGGYTGALAVNISGSNIALQVTPASSNSTVWTTQYRLI